MSEEKRFAEFGEDDRSVFFIEHPRTRADAMKTQLIPKLKPILDEARSQIRDIYEVDPLEQSIITKSPSHRKEAKKTHLFKGSHIGLHPKQVGGIYHYFSLDFNLNKDGLYVGLVGSRPLESDKMFEVFRDHEMQVVKLLDELGCIISCPDHSTEGNDNLSIIRSASIDYNQQWWHTSIFGELQDFPIDEEAIWLSIVEFVGLFPIYNAVTNRLLGMPDQLEQDFAKFQDWFEGDESESSTLEWPQRRQTTVLRVVRDTAKTRRVKELHDYGCQVCGTRLKTKDGLYAEGAHIQPVGGPHNGPDTEDNILCLCPNHHVLFDRGGFSIADDLTLIGIEGRLRTVSGHSVNPSFLAYHRSEIYRK